MNFNSFKDFFSSKSSGGIVLLICVVVGLNMANASSCSSFEEFLKFKLGSDYGNIHRRYLLNFWVNDRLKVFRSCSLDSKNQICQNKP